MTTLDNGMSSEEAERSGTEGEEGEEGEGEVSPEEAEAEEKVGHEVG